MPGARRTQLLLLASALAAVPVAFGLIRAIGTGDDFRYLWMAAAAFLGAGVVTIPGRATPSRSRVSLIRAMTAVAAATACAAVTGVLQGARAPFSIAIVSLAFGLFSGASTVLATRARQR